MKFNFQKLMEHALPCVGGVLLASSLSANVALADGNETLGAPSIPIAQGTDFVSEGVSLQDGPTTVELNVPAGASVNQVLLYWGELRQGGQGANAHRMLVDGSEVQGTLIGETERSSSFRADITSLAVVSPGNNEVALASLQGDGSVQGAGLLAIYSEGAGGPSGFQYGGSAAGAVSTIGGNSVSVVEAGPLPPTGGEVEPDPVNDTMIGDVASATTVSARTVGAGNQAESTAQVEDLGVSVAGNGLSAEAISTRAAATCTDSGAVVEGASEFANLAVLGLSQPINFPPNTVLVDTPLLRVVANEQVSSGNANSSSITVTGLRITSPLPLPVVVLGRVIRAGGSDLRIATATASIECDTAVARNDVVLRDGADYGFLFFSGALQTTNIQSFDIEAANEDRDYAPTMFVIDGDALRPDVIEFYTDGVLSTTLNDQLDESDGANTDVDNYGPLNIPAGTTSVGMRPTSTTSPGRDWETPDSISWVFTAFTLRDQAPRRLYNGRATVLQATLAGISNTAVADTGELPSSGGDLSDSVVDLALPSLLASVTGSAATLGAGDQTESGASVEQLDVIVMGNTITADLIESNASASCAGNSATVGGMTSIANLVVNGNAVDTSLVTEIPVPGGTLFIDEQVATGSGNSRSIQVNALRLFVPNPVFDASPLANVVVSASKAGITCN